MSIQPDIDLSVDFLKRFHPGRTWSVVSISGDKKKIRAETFSEEKEADLRKFLGECNKAGDNVYFTVNTLLRNQGKKASENDVKDVVYLHVDVDPRIGEDFEAEQSRIRTMFESTKIPRPTVLVFSGGGYQAFWRLVNPIEVRGNRELIEDAKLYNRQLENVFGGDSCHSLDHIMRLPGTVNVPKSKKKIEKGQKEALATVVWFEDRSYELNQFAKAPKIQDMSVGGSTGDLVVDISGPVRQEIDIDSLPDSVSGRVRVAIVQGSNDEEPLKGDNGRSEWLFYVCCELVRAGLSDEVIYAIITDPSNGISSSVLDKGNSRTIERYAVRQIQRAKEFSRDPNLERLNREYALVESVGGKCRIVKEVWNPTLKRQEIDLQEAAGFMRMYGNQFVEVGKSVMPLGKWWLSHPNRRTYTTIVFDPKSDHPSALNLWRGFAVDALPGDCSLYLEHLRKNLCGGNHEWYEYLIGWMANAVQNPGVPAGTAVVLRGRQGTGKGFFAKTFGHLFGCHYRVVTNPDHLVGKFNAHLEDAVVVFADEALYAGNKKHENTLKSIITEETLPVEAKFQDARECRNCIHLIMASNEDWVVPASLDDRRFFVLRVSDDRRQDSKYFRSIKDQMEAGGYQALLHFLLTYDLSTFNQYIVPKTDELRQQQRQSLSPIQAFWFRRLSEGRQVKSNSGWSEFVIRDYIVSELFREESNRYGSYHGAFTAMSMFVKQVFGIDKERSSVMLEGSHAYLDHTGREVIVTAPWAWKFPPLERCREMWDREYGKHEWEVVPECSAVEQREF